jgi:hypothetical protein
VLRVSLLYTSATVWPIVPAPDDRWWWAWSSRWNENWQGKPKYPEETCHSATLSTTNPTWPDLGSKPCCRGGNLATNCLSYGTARILRLVGIQSNYAFGFLFYTQSMHLPKRVSSHVSLYSTQILAHTHSYTRIESYLNHRMSRHTKEHCAWWHAKTLERAQWHLYCAEMAQGAHAALLRHADEWRLKDYI